MNFEIVGEPVKASDYFQVDITELVDILNKDYNEWVFVKNDNQSMNGIYHVVDYKYSNNNVILSFNEEHAGSSTIRLDNLDNIDLKKRNSHFNLLHTDTIYKLEEAREGQPRVRWYKKGKLKMSKNIEIRL